SSLLSDLLTAQSVRSRLAPPNKMKNPACHKIGGVFHFQPAESESRQLVERNDAFMVVHVLLVRVGVVVLACPEVAGAGYTFGSVCVIPYHKVQPPGAVSGHQVRVWDIAVFTECYHLDFMRVGLGLQISTCL